MENITLYEAMQIIDEYLNEKAHTDPNKPNEKIHGTKARIIAGAHKEINDLNNNDYKRTLNKIRRLSADNYYGTKHNDAGNDIKYLKNKPDTKGYDLALFKAQSGANSKLRKSLNDSLLLRDIAKSVAKSDAE
jgi:hypothetical protein